MSNTPVPTSVEALQARWDTQEGQHRLKNAIAGARYGTPWEHVLEGFPHVHEVPNGRDLRGTDLIEQNMQDRSLPKVQETYTVMIPVQRVKEVDGKKVTVVEYVKEQRTRERYVMVRKSRPVPAGYRFKDIKGTDIPRKAMIGKLGMGTGKMLVQIFPGQKNSTEFKSLLKDDVVFMIADQVPPPAAKGR